ncbi:MAG: PAS domain S-box protein [Gemmatimonadaceae bacterium]|nr:PAS domain S-box protein [Gemmatimonadaceae bacterium]
MTLTRKIGLLLLLPLAGSLASVGFFASHLSETRNDGHFINVAGRQRMLSAQLGAWARMVAIGQEEDREGLRDRVAEFDNVLTILLHGGDILEGTLEPAPPETRRDLEAVLDLWRGLKPDLDTVAAMPRTDPRFAAAYGRAETSVPALNGASHRVVVTFEARANRLRRQMLAVLAAIAAATGVVFIVGIWLTRRFIVRPIRHLDVAARRISGGDFSQRLEVNTRDELATLVGTFNDMTGHVERLLEALQLRRKHAEKIVSSVPAGLLIADSELRVLAVNRSFIDRSRCEQAALVGRPIIDVLGIPELEPHLRHVLATQETRSGLLHAMQYPGTSAMRPVKIAVTGTRLAEEEEEEEEELLVVVEDLSEEERLAVLARASERRFQEVVENATDGIVLMGKDGVISSFNRAAEKMFGWRREEILGKPATLLMPEKYRAALELGVARYADTTGKSAMLGITPVIEGLRKDGSIFPIECTISGYRNNGDIVFTGILRDITERQRTEEALRRSETSFRTLIERSPDAIAVYRLGCFVYVNPTVVTYLGYDRADELVGRPVLDVVPPDNREVVATRMRVMADTGEPAPAREERFLRKDGGVMTAEVVALPLVFDGEPAIVAVARDVTERKQLAAKMMQMDRMIAIGTVVASVGHEINNPLTYMVTNLDFLARELPEIVAQVRAQQPIPMSARVTVSGTPATDPALRLAEFQQVLDEAREGAERVRKIVLDLKVLSSTETDRLEPVAVQRVAESAINMAWGEIRHRARLVKEYAPMPPVIANESRLVQVILNLLVNAVHAIPEGRAETNEIRIRTFADGERVCIEVRDTGLGIPAENLARIFDPFFTTKPFGQGTGLGLSICQSIVQAFGGEIGVESEVGKGSAFRVVLLAAREGLDVSRPLSPVPVAPGRRGRILIVDDEPLVGAALRRILTTEHDVVVVVSGREVLERLGAGECFDLIFCDLMMPEMTGMDLHVEILRVYPDHASRMIFVTGGAFTPKAREFLDQVPNQRLDKPFDLQNIRALVRELLP